MLQLWLIPHPLEDKPNVVFQHDGAPPHVQNGAQIELALGVKERFELLFTMVCV
jgi:hypothetical protein